MSDPLWTQEQRDILAAHIARGVTRVQNGDQVVQYGSIAEMMSLLDRIDSALSNAAGTRRATVSYMRMPYRRFGGPW
jgi:hypothetical protein